ncbi:ABC transporter ATP-binding protein [Streptomyces iconiensis]|uniref:ABC transporter ATP-binding protein n=1 Tax=Streptomyces iconiensis TaxID=1384038 RepID=A0ABT6ZT05_9ACTN|nr:ABC transporter ATP-binding protein [Streptomyces iconiensis]MDJ1132202.1 ABC transporter ATP-binding protein [Streptomyces iconiensis]
MNTAEFDSMNAGLVAIEASGLGMRYRRGWALQECSFRLPAGRVCGLVGPNGAGKSTLLSLAAGFGEASAGRLRVFGADPRTRQAREQVGYLAQNKPLYPRMTVTDTLRMGRELNRANWDQRRAEGIVRAGDVPLHARAGSLSGGQRTRLALALCFGKRPRMLMLDEPMADLDPLVRHEMTALLMAEAAEYGTTVLTSTHTLPELEGVCDYLLVLADGRVRMAGEADELAAAHSLVVGALPAADSGQQRKDGAATGPVLPSALDPHTVVEAQVTGRQFSALVRRGAPLPEGPAWSVSEPSMEQLLLSYLRSPEAPALLMPSADLPEMPAAQLKDHAA